MDEQLRLAWSNPKNVHLKMIFPNISSQSKKFQEIIVCGCDFSLLVDLMYTIFHSFNIQLYNGKISLKSENLCRILHISTPLPAFHMLKKLG